MMLTISENQVPTTTVQSNSTISTTISIIKDSTKLTNIVFTSTAITTTLINTLFLLPLINTHFSTVYSTFPISKPYLPS